MPLGHTHRILEDFPHTIFIYKYTSIYAYNQLKPSQYSLLIAFLERTNPLGSLSSFYSENTYKHKTMGVIRLPVVTLAKQILRMSTLTASRAASTSSDVPRGFLAVYVGEKQKQRFVVPVSYLNQPSFQDLLRKAEEEFGFNHPMGGLTIPCRVDTFIDVTSRLSGS